METKFGRQFKYLELSGLQFDKNRPNYLDMQTQILGLLDDSYSLDKITVEVFQDKMSYFEQKREMHD